VYVGRNSTSTDRSQQIATSSEVSPDLSRQSRWFSQVQQDLLVKTLLRGKRGGYFVDLAANDAVRISNTYALETYYGWTGLAIEPNPLYWSSLAHYRKCRVAAAVVGSRTGVPVRFKFPNRAPAKGGIVDERFDNKEASHFGEDQTRYTVSLRDVFERFDVPSVIDYLSLDVEGAETFVMESFPFDRYRFNLLTVERPDANLIILLERQGYKMLKQLKKWGETIWAHREIEATLDLSALQIDTEHYKYREKVEAEQQ
jgi:hypothetical protein